MHSPRTIERTGPVDSRMRTRPVSLSPTAALSGIWGLLLIVFVVAALYFGRLFAIEMLQPDLCVPGALDNAAIEMGLTEEVVARVRAAASITLQ